MMNRDCFSIAVVEDNEWYNKLLVHTLSLNPDYVLSSYLTAKDFLNASGKMPDVVTLDIRLPDMNGVELLTKIKETSPNTEVIIISEQDNIQTAVDLMKSGAYDYIVKEKDIRNRLHITIEKIRGKSNLINKIEHLQQEVISKYDLAKSIVGSSAAIQESLKLIEKTLNNSITVMITGETGTGKEVVAKAIHYNSARRNKNFVAVNLAAIPTELIESELFGHEKGSFTGAANRRIGKFEEADKGTLFLDEIGELELSLQAKLLRAIQEKEIVRIGSNAPVKVDCRIIAATHRNLKEEVKKGRFREDLFYRLMGFPVELPPLRMRGKDILLLAKYFADTFCRENRISIKAISEESRKKLMSYHYPGNVRELKSLMELAVVMSNNNEIKPEDISFLANDSEIDTINEELSLRQHELKIVTHYLKKYDNDVKRVAEKLDIGQATVYRMIKEMQQGSRA